MIVTRATDAQFLQDADHLKRHSADANGLPDGIFAVSKQRFYGRLPQHRHARIGGRVVIIEQPPGFDDPILNVEILGCCARDIGVRRICGKQRGGTNIERRHHGQKSSNIIRILQDRYVVQPQLDTRTLAAPTK